MRTTIILNDDLVREAQRLSQIKGKTELIHKGLQALIEKYACQRLIALGGSQKDLKMPRRRRYTLHGSR